MLRFKVFNKGTPAKSVNLDSVYLVGNDRVPLRVDLSFVDGEIRCEPRARGAAAMSIAWPVEGVGVVTLETARLMERRQPYNLNVELARGQLMRISQKREDWGLYDFPEGQPLYQRIDAARDLLIEAITAPDEATASGHGDACTAAGVKVGEDLGLFHADIRIQRRHADRQFAKRPFGCRVDVSEDPERSMRGLREAFDFVSVPFTWRSLEPREGAPDTSAVDTWVQSLRRHKVSIRGHSLLSFQKAHLPQWLLKEPGSYERLRDCVSRHVKHVLTQFGPRVRSWEIIAGLHAHNAFQLSFEQIMELTRMSAILVKQTAPRSTAVVGIVSPWGEYYARDARTVPPFLYADMVVQSGVNFDAFGLEMRFGTGEPGHFARDMMQISSMLDRFGGLGKPLHITAAGVPSAGSPAGGTWRGGWSEAVQSQWVREFYQVAMSKPFVETVCWQSLSDAPGEPVAGGLLRADQSQKPAYEEICALRRRLSAEPKGEPAMDLSSNDGLES